MFGKTIYSVNGTNIDRMSISVFTDLISYGQVQGLHIIIIMQ